MKTCGFSSVSLPSRGAFHLSLTVLVHYRSLSVFSLGSWSTQLPTRFLVSRGTHDYAYRAVALSSTGLSPSLATRSSNVRLEQRLLTRHQPVQVRLAYRTTPHDHRLHGHSDRLVWAPPRSLAATEGINLCSSPYLDVSVRAVPSGVPMYSTPGAAPYRAAGCPIRRSPDHCLVAGSPTLFAAAHVLLRRATPRHPPHAFVPSSSFPCHGEHPYLHRDALPVYKGTTILIGEQSRSHYFSKRGACEKQDDPTSMTVIVLPHR